MAQQIKVPTFKLDDLSSNPEPSGWKERTKSHRSSSGLHTGAMVQATTLSLINK